jgi:hypothetical protein
MPRATAETRRVRNHGVDALVFPYVPAFLSPSEPVYTIDDPAFVKSRTLSRQQCRATVRRLSFIVVPVSGSGRR